MPENARMKVTANPTAAPQTPPAVAPRPHSRTSLARRLRLQQLMVFEQVVEAGSILAASRALSLTQPAVSKAIQELESQLGGLLFVRGKRGVVPTQLGTLVERHAKTILGELRYLAEDLNAAQSGSAGQVVIGTLITASGSLLPEAIRRLRRLAPDVVVTVRVGSNALLFPALARGELDVVVGVLPDDSDPDAPGSEPLLHVPLYRESLCVVVGRQNPLATRKRIGLAELHGADWIVPTRESLAYPSVRAFFQKAGLSLPARRTESVSILTNLELLNASDMVALMPHSAAQRFDQAGSLVVLPIQGLGAFGVVGYTVRSDREPTASTQVLLAALREAGAGLGQRLDGVP